ncbi:MAG TPA: P-II family nitrogen regulator [Candidatus Acidoferrales bacterium]|nr:P-II family nitrogen regulator [Candidatus Acidoferrales bacterium]
MKKIEIFIPPEKVYDVCEGLHGMGIYGIVLSESRIIDKAIEEDSEKLDDKIIIPPKIALVLTLTSSLVEPVVFTVLSIMKAGSPANGRITISSFEEVIDTDDEETDTDMLQWYQLAK